MVLWSTVSLLIINKFWTKLSRSIIFLSLPLWRWQIIIFCNNWVQNCFIIWLPSLFLMNIFGKWSNLHFYARVIARRRKAWFHLCMSRILFAAKHSRTKLRMSGPLFVGRYLQVTWWALGQWKGTKICIARYTCMVYHTCVCHHCIKFENKLLPPRTSRSYSW